MTNREIPCVYYQYEGCCDAGREGTFRKACQTCNLYKAKKGAAPARKNLRREKLQKHKEHDMARMMRDYDS